MTPSGLDRPATAHPVLLHGFTGSAASWQGVVDGMSARGLVPVTLDLPGHGVDVASPMTPTLGTALDVVRAAGRWPADLVGYSMGARIALHFAAAHGTLVRRLVLESGSPGLATEAERAARRASDAAVAERLETEGIHPFVDAWESLGLFVSQASLPAETRALQRARRLTHDPRGLAGALRGLGTGTLPSLWDRLPDIAVPTLLVAGELDGKFVEIARRMAALMPRARLLVVRGAGHRVHLERPADWLESVCDFLTAKRTDDGPRSSVG